MKAWPSWLLGSMVGAIRRTLPSTSPPPRILIRAVWPTWILPMSSTGTRPTRSNSLRAMIENSASPLPDATAPIVAVEASTSPATGACTWAMPPSGSVSRASDLPGGDGIAGLGQDFRNLQPRPFGPHHRLLARDHDAGHLDDIRKARLRRREHRDRRALGSVGLVGGERGAGEGEEESSGENLSRRGEGGQRGHRNSCSRFRASLISGGRRTRHAPRHGERSLTD